MNELETLRAQISETDAEMAELFEKRMELCAKIAAYKKERGLGVRDPARESRLIEVNRSRIRNPEVREYYVRYLQDVIELSCEYQTRIMDRMQDSKKG